MSLSQKIADNLPLLRRYARALTGAQADGDAREEEADERGPHRRDLGAARLRMRRRLRMGRIYVDGVRRWASKVGGLRKL